MHLSHRARSVLALLFLVALISAQAASFAGEHGHHSGDHCCALCHAGPLPFLQAASAVSIAPNETLAWIAVPAESECPHDAPLSTGSSRAPPSCMFA